MSRRKGPEITLPQRPDSDETFRCPQCAEIIPAGAPVIFRRRRMYHLACDTAGHRRAAIDHPPSSSETPQHHVEEAEGTPVGAQRARSTLLHVEDREEVRYLRGRALREAGFHVIEAALGREVLPAVSGERPDLVLMDVQLPDADGFDLCREIKQRAGLPVILISSVFTSDRDRVEGFHSGADSYLTEPVAPADLIVAVGALLRERAAEA